MDLRAAIKTQMEKQDISIPAMARALGLNHQTLYNYFAGKSELTAANLERLLAELGGKVVFDGK